jgi:hypothetical protein
MRKTFAVSCGFRISAPVIRKAIRLLSMCATGLVLSGCASNPEDRAFFNTGWVNPEKGAEERMFPTKKPAFSGTPEEPPERLER